MTASSSSSSTISSPLWLEIFEAARLNDVQTLEHVFASQSLDEDQLVPLINRKHPQFDRTALMLAVAWNAVAAVKLLIKLGAKVDIQDPYGNSALHLGVEGNAIAALKHVIVAANMKINQGECDLMNQKNYLGFTPLHLAAQIGHAQVCKLLLLSGARMSVMTSPPKKYGTPKSALDLAILEGHEKVVLLMRGWDDSWALQQQRNIHPVRHLHHLQEQENIGSVLVSSRSNHTITTVELSPWEKGLPIWLWTHRHIDAFLLSLHLQQYTRSFQRFFIDGPALLELTESKLERLKISNPRHRQKILEAIQALRLQLAYN